MGDGEDHGHTQVGRQGAQLMVEPINIFARLDNRELERRVRTLEVGTSQVPNISNASEWDEGAGYNRYDIVSYQGGLYVAIALSIAAGTEPTDTDYWRLVIRGATTSGNDGEAQFKLGSDLVAAAPGVLRVNQEDGMVEIGLFRVLRIGGDPADGFTDAVAYMADPTNLTEALNVLNVILDWMRTTGFMHEPA